MAAEEIQLAHSSTKKLLELYYLYKDKVGSDGGMFSLIWKALAPQIPELLSHLDKDEDALGKISKVVSEVAEAFREDA